MTLEEAKIQYHEAKARFNKEPRIGKSYPKIGEHEYDALCLDWNTLQAELLTIAPGRVNRPPWQEQPEPASPAATQIEGEKKPPAAPICPDPLNQTLEKLKGSSAAKNLIRFLTRHADQKATLVDTARHRNRGCREPTRRDISSTKQQVRRTAANLALRDAPLRIEYCWIQQIISLVDRNGNPPPFISMKSQM